jgi:8-oxo-dGTP pyrophosphatase MutT (NUDIX family)
MTAKKVASLVAGYQPWNALEARHLAALRQLLEDCGDCFDRKNLVPGHITSSALVVDTKLTQVLLIFHAKLQRWLQPGGHVERTDKSLVDAARREVLEETGLAIDAAGARLLDIDVHRIPSSRTHPSHLHYDLSFLFMESGGDLVPATDAKKACWFSLHEAETRAGDDSIRRMLDKLEYFTKRTDSDAR